MHVYASMHLCTYARMYVCTCMYVCMRVYAVLGRSRSKNNPEHQSEHLDCFHWKWPHEHQKLLHQPDSRKHTANHTNRYIQVRLISHTFINKKSAKNNHFKQLPSTVIIWSTYPRVLLCH